MTRSQYQPGPETGHYHDGLGVNQEAIPGAVDLTPYQLTSAKDQASGYAGLDGSGKIALSALPGAAATDTETAAAVAALSAVYQPLDSDLTAIAALTTTSFGRSLLAAADAAGLQTLAGISTFIKTLVDDADAATARATLGLSTRAVEFVIDGGGSVITAGVKGDLMVNVAWTNIAGVWMLADQSGSLVVDVYKTDYSTFDPTTHPAAGDKITASAPPTISGAKKSTDATLTGWTKTGSAHDILRFVVTGSPATITRCTVILELVV